MRNTFVLRQGSPVWPRDEESGRVLSVKPGIGATYIEHVAIIVTDLERSRRFYAEVLGFPEVPRPESFDFPGAWYQLGPTCLHLLDKPGRDSESSRHFLSVPGLLTLSSVIVGCPPRRVAAGVVSLSGESRLC